ncbi:hypothetical protein SAMN05216535_2266 [Stutzerimonas xanthomarina]|uniref:Uncharacterized protein n=2 Tax=Stutzerimonas xanthomarina TaxID=271420 RepID=A0A1M5MXZ9_9GAMM|nr:hypothetical protein SAMN05216535_2266 [Stutzerimonas xanthomarina]SHG82002.1 hypothetical protein SAMN02744645_1551 [Stutzerimonas xanthomarina DSM 18231]
MTTAVRRMGATYQRDSLGCTHPTFDRSVVGAGQQKCLAPLASPTFSLQLPAALKP